MELIGRTIGNYQITKQLGEGGMGAVYLAEHPVIGKKVALKVLHLEMAKNPEIVARFFNEAKAIHTIGHRNIVEVLDFGQTPDGYPYFIMEYLNGLPLDGRLAKGPFAPALAVKVASQIADALQAAHDKGIVHRDLKPQNVFVLGSDDDPVVKILDFGVAKIAQQESAQSVKTRTGSLMGTPIYMSPEQCRGSGSIDHRTDVYALGIMLFEMIAGRPPFVAEGVGELFAKHMMEQPVSLDSLAPQAPPAVVAAVARALKKNATERQASMSEFRAAINGEAVSAGGAAVQVDSLAGTMIGVVAPAVPLPGSPGATPKAQSTTFSSATAEVADAPAAAPRKRAPVFIGGGVAAAAAVAVVIGLGSGGRHPGPAPVQPGAAAMAEEPAGTAGSGPKQVEVVLRANQPGAHVFRQSDGKDLGPVPLTLRLPADGGKPTYIFRLAGFKDAEKTLTLQGTRVEAEVALEKAPAAAPPPAAASSRATRASHGSHTAAKSNGPKEEIPGNDDDLVKPGW